MPQLIVRQNSGNYRVIPFIDALTIGRGSDNDLVLDSPRVSRHHGKIESRNDGLYLLDLGSTNGIWLNGEKITTIRIDNNSTFAIDDFLLTVIDFKKTEPEQISAGHGQNSGPFAEQTIVFGLDSLVPADVDQGRKETESVFFPEALLRHMRLLARIDNKTDFFNHLLSSALELSRGDHGFIATRNKEGDLIYRAAHGLDKPDRNIDKTLLNLVMENGQAVCRQAGDGKTQNQDSGTRQDSRQIFCLPLPDQNGVEGCLYLGRDGHQGQPSLLKTQLEVFLLFGFVLLERIRHRDYGRHERQQLQNSLEQRNRTVIRSRGMVRLYEDIRTIAPINVPVLILGEPGTGKELVASALHEFSSRKGAYVPLNCSAIPEGIFESELFGSVKGAFHNAANKPGKLELANGGTLFLDEIGDMAAVLQPKLLRFLENSEITRLGDTKSRALDVRVVAATNQDLEKKISQGAFRDDLFQRLSCFVLKVPPLRERREDIEPLIHYFLKRFASEYNWQEPAIAAPVLHALENYSWPGNIRELRNTVLRLSVQARGKTISMDDLARIGENFSRPSEHKVSPNPTLEEMERKYFRQTLTAAGGNISEAAKLAGIARSTFYQKMKKYSITPAPS